MLANTEAKTQAVLVKCNARTYIVYTSEQSVF